MQTPTFIWCKDKLRIHKNSPKVPHIFAYVGFFYVPLHPLLRKSTRLLGGIAQLVRAHDS